MTDHSRSEATGPDDTLTHVRSHAAVPDPAEGTGRVGTFALAALVAGVGTYLLVGTLTMQVPATADWPGPRFFPVMVTALSFTLALVLVATGVRQSRAAVDAPPAPGDESADIDHADDRRWGALALAVLTLVLFVLVLEPLGWLLSGTLLFWGLATSLGSRRPLNDLAVAIVVSSVVQLVFSAGLGLYLPVGVMGAF